MLYGLKKILKSGAVSCRLDIKSLHDDGRKMNQSLQTLNLHYRQCDLIEMRK